MVGSMLYKASGEAMERGATVFCLHPPAPHCRRMMRHPRRFWLSLSGLCATATAQLSLSIVNQWSSNVTAYAYITGRDADNHIVFLQADNSWFSAAAAQLTTAPRPVPDTVAIPLAAAGSTNVRIPGPLSSGRVWIAQGPLTFSLALNDAGDATLIEPSATDPSDANYLVLWGFVELTYTPDAGLYVNLSYVDFVGVPLGIAVEASNGDTQDVLGLPATALPDLCQQLHAQGDHPPWDQLCITDAAGAIHRILSPNSYIAASHTTAFDQFYGSYVDAVWSTYRTQPLTVDSQGASGNVTCSVQAQALSCAGDSRDYGPPSAADIFGCNSGPFVIDSTDNAVHAAVVPRLCAAFQRGTLLLPGGDQQPRLDPTQYYTTDPNNLYSKFVHQLELDGKGYAFAYDDVDPWGADQSGVIASTDARQLIITVGGPTVV